MGSNTLCIGLPVKDRSRALDFYSAVLGRDLRKAGAPPPRFERRFAGSGVMVHLLVEQCLDKALEIVWSTGGQVLEPEALESAAPSAVVLDTEGNRIALCTQL